MSNTCGVLPASVQEIIVTIEAHDFSVTMYEEEGIVCGAEIEAWTDGGVDMIHFIDLRGKDIASPEDWKDEISEIASGFSVDEEIDIHRQDKRYREAFTCSQSVRDFENWQNRLRALAQAVLYPEIEEAEKMGGAWELGSDLNTCDSLLDGLTFDDLILAVRCNCRDINPASVKKELQDMLASRMQDMEFLLENNMEAIIEKAGKERGQ